MALGLRRTWPGRLSEQHALQLLCGGGAATCWGQALGPAT